MSVNAEHLEWARRYSMALNRHLKPGREASLHSASALGREAVAIRLETLDVAGVHEHALKVIARNAHRPRAAFVGRAKQFFLETLVPIEETHRAVQKTRRLVAAAAEALRRRTRESSSATRHLERGVALRKVSEARLGESRRHLDKLLLDSKRLQSRLREQMCRVLSTQENVRHRASLLLQDEIAQDLLALHLRLLTLKVSAEICSDKMKKEIAGTQKLVRQSRRKIQRLSREIEDDHKA